MSTGAVASSKPLEPLKVPSSSSLQNMELSSTTTNNRAGTPPEYLVNANERQYLAKLCWLLYDAGTYVMRQTFDGFHPPIILRQHLGQHHVKSVLHRLWDQKILTDRQWRQLYPTKKYEIVALSSTNYDAHLLSVLLQFVCHLSPPYPHGWSSLPLPQDSSLSADIVRLQMYLQQAGSLGGVRHEEYPVLWKQIVEVLLRMGGPEVRVKITRIDQETLTPEQQAHFISLVKSSWGSPDEGALGKLRKLGAVKVTGRATPRASNKKRGANDKGSGEQDGVSAEERVVLSRTHKQLCDLVMAEDIVDRLVQGHVLHFNDKQEVLTPGRNLDRMQLLISKIMHSRQTSAFKVLMDALKFKYPRVFEALNKVKKIVQRDGVTEVMDVVAVCQEGLATHFRSMFSRVTPLPWSDCQTSIRDVYVPLEVVTEDGKKLQLSQVLPPVMTSGRGRRVLVEGESGSGKTYLSAMLTYQWSSQKTYFTSCYPFLVYLDARMVKGPLYKAVHSLALPENIKVGAEEFWNVLEENARDVIFIIDGFDEDHGNEELKDLILGETLRHATVLLTSRPEARAGRWMCPDERMYVLGLSTVNVGRCLKSYAVIAQMTSEEYEEFSDVINGPDFEFRSQLVNPYVCLAVFGIYVTTGEEGLCAVTTLTTLFQQYLVAMVTGFCRRLVPDEAEGAGGELSADLVAAISLLQNLAYVTLITQGKLLSESDLEGAARRLRACAMQAYSAVYGDVSFSPQQASNGGGEVTVNGHTDNGPASSRGGAKGKGKGVSPATMSDSALLTRIGLLNRVGGASGGRWVFTCSMTREFLAARHLVDLKESSLEKEFEEQKVLRHPRFAQTAAFLCGLFRQDNESPALASLFKELSIQVLKHSKRITFKDDVSSIGTAPSEIGDGENGVGYCNIMTFSHALQALSECPQASSSQGGPPDFVSEMVTTLPKAMVVQRDGLIPLKCLHGLALAVMSPGYHLTRLEIDLLPHHVHQSSAIISLAEALSAGAERLQDLVVRWHSLPLLVTFLRTCLAKAPPLHSVLTEDCSKAKRVKSESASSSGGGVMATVGGHSVNVNASTWAELQDVCSLLRNTRSFALIGCWASHVVSQWVIYLPHTIESLDFTGSAINKISAADLGSKLEESESCKSLILADTDLENSDMTVLFHDLKLNCSLKHLSLAACTIDRLAGTALAEYIRLDNSMRVLDLSRCHVSMEACVLLADALSENQTVVSLDVTDAAIEDEGVKVLKGCRKDRELELLGLYEEYYA